MATFGSPNIATPRPEDWRAWQTAISNARQRIEYLEQQLGITSSALQQTSSTSTTNLNSILTQLTNLSLRVKLLENAAATDIGVFIAGESITIGTGVVPISSTTVGEADPSDPTRMFGLIGMAINSATAGGSVQVQRRGVYAPPGVSGLTAGRAVYVTHTGITQTPDYEATALPMGIAASATQIFIGPDLPALLYPTYSSGFADPFMDYLPVTYRALNALASLEAQIDALPFSSGAADHMMVPVTYGGIAYRVTAGDIARLGGGSANLQALIDALSYNSGVDAHMQVPVTIAGVALRVNAGDIAALASTNLETLIDALSYNSGVDAHMQIPVTIGGVAVRVNAGDVADLTSLARLFAQVPYSSGVDANGLVPVEIGGIVSLVNAGDIARLGRKPFWRGAAWDGGGLAIVATSAAIVRCLPVPANGTIVEAFAEGNGGPGSLTAEVWYTSYAGAPATSANKISGTSPITISADYKSSDTTLTGWGTTVSEGGILVFKMNTCSSFTAATVGVRMVPT